MDKIEKKIQQLEKQIQENQVQRQKELLITEMKKIGIEKLPYSYSALKNFIDSETMNVHYNKHYKGYVDKLNSALSKKKYGDLELEKIIKNISRYDKTIRNNAGGAFNHALFWNMLTPEPKKLKGELYDKIVKEFGTFINFKKKFETIAKERFGSGWVWLVITPKNNLKIMSTPNQDNPLMNVIEGGGFPLLGLDLWEHAYYLKYRNKRDEYITNFWKVVNWDFVSKLFEMRTQTRLLESQELKKVLSEGKSEMCSTEENNYFRELFNKNEDVKKKYRYGIDSIVREVFNEYYVYNPPQGQLPGVFNFEGPGRSVINKLNTNYTCFCILLKDVNKVITKTTKESPITFSDKTPEQQLREVERFIEILKGFKYRIFSRESATLHNLLRVLTTKDEEGSKREEITAAIMRRFLRGQGYTIQVIGGPGVVMDAIGGIDLIITRNGQTKTGQVKPFREAIDNGNTITMIGTGGVRQYTVDYMIFQRGKKVMVFDNNGSIEDGQYVFPRQSLVFNIE